jgi:diguanylate cyclase (GGDEF)-like protein
MITGYETEEVLNFNCFDNILRHVDTDGNELCFNGCPLQKTLQTGEKVENTVYLHHKMGHRVPVIVRTFPLYDTDGKILAVVETFSDAKFKQTLYTENRRLQELTTKDQLTNIYNRSYIDYQLKALKDEFSVFSQPFGVAFMDIDNFKNVNDTYGHAIGDEVLKLVSRTISSNIREDDVFGRYGGEEFVLILKLSTKEALERISNKLRVLIEKSSLKIGKQVIKVTISIGITMFKKNDTKDSVIERADNAMYKSKQTGKNKVTIY